NPRRANSLMRCSSRCETIANSATHPWLYTNDAMTLMSLVIFCKSVVSPQKAKRQNRFENWDLQISAAVRSGDSREIQQLQHVTAGHRPNCQLINSESYQGRQSPRGASSKSGIM